MLRHVPTDRPFDFSKELFPLLLEMGRPLYGHVCEGYWQDIGNLDQFRQANFDALDGQIALDIPGIRLRGNIWIGEGVEIDDLEGVEGPAFVGNYCRDLAGGDDRRLLGARRERDAPRARPRRASVIDQSTLHRPQRERRGRDPRPSCDIRSHVRIQDGAALGDEVIARRAERRHARRPHLPLQGGGVRRARPREPDLGVAATSRLFGRTASPG